MHRSLVGSWGFTLRVKQIWRVWARRWIRLRLVRHHTVPSGYLWLIQLCWGWMLWYRLGRGFVCTPFPDHSAHRSSRESVPGWSPSIAKPHSGRAEYVSDPISLHFSLTGSGHDLSPLLGVAEAVAPEGTQFIASDLSTEVAETILNLELPQ